MKNLIIRIAIILFVGGIAIWVISDLIRARKSSHKSTCHGFLCQLDAAKEQAAMEYKIPNGGTVAVEQLDRFIKDGTQSLKCPDDPKHSFNTSYSLGVIGSNPLCLINPSSHTL